jgi:hypothetical protein
MISSKRIDTPGPQRPARRAGLVAGCIFAALTVISFAFAAQGSGIDPVLAGQYFQEARAFCLKDNGNLWGVSLDGPLLLADPRTRSIVANQSDREGKLTANGNVFVGRLPEAVNIANTSISWAGVKWTIVMWPLPSDKQARARLMAHEMFHRIQDDLGLPAANPSNDHLDALEGRVMLRLEWRALNDALNKQGAGRRQAIEDALVFRARRRELFKAAETERALEINEGLAQYTGVKLCGLSAQETIDHVRARLKAAEKGSSFGRSFAYVTGPAYGVLLDETGRPWRKKLAAQDDLGAILGEAHSISPAASLKEGAERRSLKYDGRMLRAEETAREEDRKKRIAEHRRRFVEGPVLALALGDEVKYSFDPLNVESLDGYGTVYPTMRISDDWGVLEVTGGALMIREGQRAARVHVSAPRDLSARPLAGDGWTLSLNDGWQIVSGERPGDYSLKKEE